jgi:hypothetical protein
MISHLKTFHYYIETFFEEPVTACLVSPTFMKPFINKQITPSEVKIVPGKIPISPFTIPSCEQNDEEYHHDGQTNIMELSYHHYRVIKHAQNYHWYPVMGIDG